MKQYDLMILGPATRDVNIDYTGEESRIVGGAVTFCTPAAAAAGPIRAWDIPVPDFKTAAAAAKPPARKPLRLPELPDLSVPAPPEIRI